MVVGGRWMKTVFFSEPLVEPRTLDLVAGFVTHSRIINQRINGCWLRAALFTWRTDTSRRFSVGFPERFGDQSDTLSVGLLLAALFEVNERVQ